MTITGECGDQIFGSQLLEAYLLTQQNSAVFHLGRYSAVQAAFVKSELTALYEHGLDAPWQELRVGKAILLHAVDLERTQSSTLCWTWEL